jgi:hypothetical protein
MTLALIQKEKHSRQRLLSNKSERSKGVSNYIRVDHNVFSEDQQTMGSSNLRTSKTKMMSSQRHSNILEHQLFAR